MSRARRAIRGAGSAAGGRRWMRRRTVLAAAALGLTGCVGSQDDENLGQAEGNATGNETDSVENTSDEETTAEEEEDEEPDTDSEYTDVEDNVYTVESVGSGEYRITADDEQLIGTASHSRDLRDRENPDIFSTSDGNPEIYTEGPTDEGNAVLFYDDGFADEEPVRFYSIWARGAQVDELDEPKDEILHNNTTVPDNYVDEVEDGLYKVTIPFEDMYEDWDNLKQGAHVTIRIGHLENDSAEKGGFPRGEEVTYYQLTIDNTKF